MAHFAELNEHNYVKRIVVIDNSDLLDENGNESEALGIACCNELCGESIWVQTSYNGNMRGKFAGIGDYYDQERDVFR